MQNYDARELLKFLCSEGKLDIVEALELQKMAKRTEILKNHKGKIWQGKDGWFYTYMPNKSHGRTQLRRKTKKLLNEAIIEYLERQQNNPTVKECFDEWNDTRLELGKISPGTHERNVYYFRKYLAEYSKMYVSRITERELAEFLEECPSRFNMTAKCFSNLKTIIKGPLKRAKRKGIIDFSIEGTLADLDVSEREFKRQQYQEEKEVFSEDEFPRLLRYLREHDDAQNAGVALMCATGMRVGELVSLTHADIDGHVIRISKTETRWSDRDGNHYAVKDSPKTLAGFREIVVPEEFDWVLARCRKCNPFGDYIFINRRGERMTTESFRRRMHTICKELGIQYRSPHKIRKTYGSILLDYGVDKNLIMGQMGHTNIGTTERYYHRNRKNIEKKRAILSAIPEFQTANRAAKRAAAQ